MTRVRRIQARYRAAGSPWRDRRIALLHALAHIALNAIDLARDIIALLAARIANLGTASNT